MIHRLRPRSIRSRLLLTTVVSVGAALVGPGGRFNLLFARRLDANATDQARTRAEAERTVIEGRRRRSSGREARDGATGDTVWVFDRQRAVDAPRIVKPGLDAAALARARRRRRRTSASIRLVASP